MKTLPVRYLRQVAVFFLAAFCTPILQASSNGHAVASDGTTGRQVDASAGSAPTSNWTFTAWVYPTEAGSRTSPDVPTAILTSQEAEALGGSVEILLADSGGTQRVELARAGAYTGTPSSLPVPLNQWTHIAVTVSSSNQVSYFINGAAAGTADYSGRDVTLGGGAGLIRFMGNMTNRKFKGRLDDVVIWSVARSQAEIMASLNVLPEPGDANLLTVYRFDEGSGNTTRSSNGSNSATLANGVGWEINRSIVVNTLADEFDTPSGPAISLREAIRDAEAETGRTTVSIHGFKNRTITLGSEIVISKTGLTVEADGGPITLDGGPGTNRIFNISAGSSLSLRQFTIAGGNGGGADMNLHGGAILNRGTLELVNCGLTTNSADHGGAIFQDTTGSLNLSFCVFSGNSAAVDGGAIENRAVEFSSATQCSFSSNSTTGNGGAVSGIGPFAFADCSFTANQAMSATSRGGAIFSPAALLLARSTFSSNTAFEGGALYHLDSPLAASQSTFAANTAAVGGAIFIAGSGAPAELAHLTVSENHAAGGGGGIFMDQVGANLANSIVAGNTSGAGAGDVENRGILTLTGANIIQSLADNTNTGGGISSGPAPMNVPPQLAPLGAYHRSISNASRLYGGPVWTMPPLAASMAVNGAIGSTIIKDQRGIAITGIPEIGACEHTTTINPIASQSINEDASAAARTFPFTIEGPLVPANSDFRLASGNTALVTNATYSGSGVDRSVGLTLATNGNGTSLITVSYESGEFYASRSFPLTVNPVNDPPTFTKGLDQAFLVNGGPQTVSAWATAASTGPADEGNQSLVRYTVTNDNNSLFAVQPSIALDGTLTCTPAPGQTGSATVFVTLEDDGSNVSPNINLSAVRTFTIFVKAPLSVTSASGGTGAGSLRDVLTVAATTPGGDFIHFDPALSGQSIALAAEIVIGDTASVTIDATALPAGLTIDGGPGTNRIFSVNPGKIVTLRGLNLTGGNGAGASETGSGGAIYNRGTLGLSRCVLTGNSAGAGGAIFNSTGTVSLDRCSISNNSATGNGGAIHYSTGSMLLTDCILSGNAAVGTGGAISCENTLTLIRCTLSGNSATNEGGAVFSSSNNLGQVTLSGCILNGNTALSGGAIINYFYLRLADCVLSGNRATSPSIGSGGALLHYGNPSSEINTGPPTAIITGCRFTGNSGVQGGAVLSYNALSMTDSTLSGNSSVRGGAIYTARGRLLLERSTLSGNTATDGGGIFSYSEISLTHCTIHGNSASRDDGGILNGAFVILVNSIVAGNTQFSNKTYNHITRVGANIIHPHSNGTFDGAGTVSAVDPMLAPLGDYGGPTPTLALLPGSPARNAAVGSTATVDQRGFPIVGIADIGAYETGTPGNFQAWGTEIAGTAPVFSADTDQDGVTDGLEYATRTSHLVPNAGPVGPPVPTILSGNIAAWQFSFPYRPEATDLRYIVQRGANLTGWTEIYRYDAATGIGTAQPEATVEKNSTTGVITIHDAGFLPGNCFWKLSVEKP